MMIHSHINAEILYCFRYIILRRTVIDIQLIKSRVVISCVRIIVYRTAWYLHILSHTHAHTQIYIYNITHHYYYYIVFHINLSHSIIIRCCSFAVLLSKMPITFERIAFDRTTGHRK